METWRNDPATNRQMKVLRFFGKLPLYAPTKGSASSIIAGLFAQQANRELWEKYVYFTGDDGQTSPHLQPFDLTDLINLTIPPRPSTGRRTRGLEHHRAMELAMSILKEGLPFDHPVPEIRYSGASFCFTGNFDYGTRAQCHNAILGLGGTPQDKVTTSTRYLIIGGHLSPSWAHEGYGRKIEAAMMLRLDNVPISLIAERDWVAILL